MRSDPGNSLEGDEIMEDFKGSAALNAGLISSAQAVQHYEFPRYGALIAWANQLGLKAQGSLNQAACRKAVSRGGLFAIPVQVMGTDPMAKRRVRLPRTDDARATCRSMPPCRRVDFLFRRLDQHREDVSGYGSPSHR
jgi:hypothetical protein